MFKSIGKLSNLNRVHRSFSTTSSLSRMQIDNVLVIGGGLMGSGIAQSCAQSQHQFKSIVLQDVNQKSLDKAKKSMLVSLGRMKKKMPELDEQKIVSKIQFTNEVKPTSTENLLIVEAVPELIDLKQKIFKNLSDEFGSSKSVILATNTSSLPVKEIGLHVQNKSNFAGLHFFSPVPMMKLVEVVKADQTADETIDALNEFVKNINKVSVNCKDTPGFIVNRLLIPNMGEALKMLERGDATVEDIDKAMQLGAGQPMGPFTLLDFVGIDVYKFICDAWKSKGADFIQVSPTIERMFKEGKLGRKTGQGFYDYRKK